MDKFTVDLDQVLNDFEYSELTDQYNTSRLQIDTASPLNHNNVTKHSINNVFHSLNEYLNTSIDLPSIDDIKEADVLKNNRNDNVESPESSNDDKVNISIGDCADNKSLADDNFDQKNNFVTVNDSKNIEESPENESEINEINDLENGIKNIDTNESEECDLKEDLTLFEDAQSNATIEETFNEDNPDEDNFYEASNESTNNKDNILLELDSTTPFNLKLEQNITLVEPRIIHNDQDIEENLEDTESRVNKNEEKVVNPVGFEKVTDIDDDEVDELLAELENDPELENVAKSNHKEIPMNDCDNEEEPCEKNQKIAEPSITEKELNEEQQIISENLEITPELVINEKITTENSVTVERNAELEDTLPIDEIEKINKDSIIIINEKPIEDNNVPPQKKTIHEQEVAEDTEHVQEAVVEKSTNNDIKPENVSNNDTTTNKIDDVNTSNQDKVNRPKNLPLKENDSEVQREINLIGGPGSTPYNNVYIAKEMNKQQEQDNESISSTSSNTFSDTGSTASTASTEEIRDDNDIIRNVTQQPTIPTENLETGTRELSDDGDQRRNVVDETEEGSETIGEQSTRNHGDGEIGSSGTSERQWLGKEAPLWIPDSDTTSCLHCDMKFTVLKRRHHCRACGLVLCSKCCYMRFKLEYLDAEARICNKCFDILNKDTSSSSSSDVSSPDPGSSPLRRPNPNNPLEYCSTISPLQQVSGASSTPLPAVMVPVGVLKRKGSNKTKSNKSVMFCDGIRPGSDLTNLDNDFNYNDTKTKKLEKTSTTASAGKINRNLPLIDSESNSFIPKSENSLPPFVTITKTDISYTDCPNNPTTVEQLKNNQHTFAILLSLYVHVKIVNMSCCINKTAWCFSTEGLINVGQDEIVIVLEYIDEESFVPKDIFYHINNIYADAVKGTSIKELGISLHNSSNFLDSKNHAGFVYFRPTFQCLENVIKPKEPFMVGVLIHRWETPWAKLFPLRLILRLGAEYRYYPSPIISTRHRDSVFVEIGHTIINLLADFRNFSYTLPQINGLTIHMEDKNTTVTIPINRYDQVIKSLNNSSDHILAFGGSFSQDTDSHLVCIQDTQGNENCYSTHAINIQNKPRKVTGASFIVFNGALKSSSGLTAKSNIVEDGLMIQVLPEHMQLIRDNLRAMKNHSIPCGCVNAATDETVNIVWGGNDTNFNIGVTSSIDGTSLSGIPSIRVHNGKNHYGANGNRIIRWTEVFIIQNGEDSPKNQDPVDISKISENIAKATCDALLNYLDLLVTNNCQKIGIRTNLHMDSVSYFAGSNNAKLAPIYMKSLDNELIPVLHRITSNIGETPIILELVFRILNV